MRHVRLPAPVLVAIVAAVIIVTAGCGNSNTSATNGNGCKKIGILMPDNSSSSRWESKDHPALQQAISAALPGASMDFSNANGSQYIQLSQAETDLNRGDCILVVASQDSATAASIVQEAHNKGVPVIAYDRLINDASLDYYVSFDGVAVGEAQGNYIRAHYQQYVTLNSSDNAVLISGSPTDNNALLFSKGIHQVLDPVFSAGMLVNQGEDFTQGWDNPTAEAEMDRYLAKVHDKLAIAYVANDGMAGTVIDSLTREHLNGKVLVTGQDATAAGIREILLGNQMMTVYKPIIKEAQATASLIAAISGGKGVKSLSLTMTMYKGAHIPSALLPVESVDKSNIAATVLADGYVTKAEICQDVPAGTAGIC
jgi:D-xylose transport system substrate-binding protein